MAGRYYLTEEPATGKTVRVFIPDGELTLPCTQATAYVDKGYTVNSEPYFSDIVTAISWVKSRGGGRIIVSSDYDTITLDVTVSCYLEPNVYVKNLIVPSLSDISIVGQGRVETLDIDSGANLNVNLRHVELLNMSFTQSSYVELVTAGTIAGYSIAGIDYNLKKYCNQFGITSEGHNVLKGRPTINKINLLANTELDMYDARIIGESNVEGLLNAFNSEFYNETGAAIKYQGKLTLQGCWLYSGDDCCINAGNDCGLILDDTKLYCEKTNLNSVISGTRMNVYVYGNSVARTAMDTNCTSAINNLVVNQDMTYKYSL